jgi:hypothetical protein
VLGQQRLCLALKSKRLFKVEQIRAQALGQDIAQLAAP